MNYTYKCKCNRVWFEDKQPGDNKLVSVCPDCGEIGERVNGIGKNNPANISFHFGDSWADKEELTLPNPRGG